MLFVGHAVLFIIDDFVIAIESKPVLHIAAHAENGHGLVRGRIVLQPLWPAAGPNRTGPANESRASSSAIAGIPKNGPTPYKNSTSTTSTPEVAKPQPRHPVPFDHHDDEQRRCRRGR